MNLTEFPRLFQAIALILHRLIRTEHMTKKYYYSVVACTAALVLLCGFRPGLYSTEYNLDFEYARNDSVPTQWALRNPFLTGYTLGLDHEVSQHGRTSLKAEWTGCPTVYSWGGFQSFLPGELVAGKELEISGWVKTKDSLNVCAGYGIFAYVPSKPDMTFLSKIDTVGGVRGTSDWTRHTVRQRIDEGTDRVMIAGFVSGKGTAWFDNMEFRIDGVKYEGRDIPALKTELSAKDKRQLKKYVHPLRTCEPDGGDAGDLAILGQLVGQTKVVGLGEATHGTSEIYKMKDRIIRYLAEKEGFDIFTIEANLPESYRMNDYTVRGEGDPEKLIRGLYVWPWWTEEMLDMVEWMKAYNASAPKITYTGVDMQIYASLVQQLQQRLEGCPGAKISADAIADKFQHIYPQPYRIDKELAKELDAALQDLKGNAEIAALPNEQKAWVGQYIELLHQFLSQGTDMYWRDRGMADNMLWILGQHPKSKAVLWAHNLHISKKMDRNQFLSSMGFFLNKKLGDDYRTIGFVCYEGSYTAWKDGLKAIELPAPLPGTLEYMLGQLDEPIFLLDLRKMREENAPAVWWINDLEFREAGATPEIYSNTHIPATFDYLIFIRNSEASHILKY